MQQPQMSTALAEARAKLLNDELKQSSSAGAMPVAGATGIASYFR